jgi:tellurite resistance protein TehA-like permease
MTFADFAWSRARALPPGAFAMVMATGIVSIDADQHGMHGVAMLLFGLNLVAYPSLLLLTALRLLRFHHELAADVSNPARGAGFLTLAAATCVLGSQCLSVVYLPTLAYALMLAGALLWATLIYLLFASTMAARVKPGLARSIHGGWLVAVVATQALAALIVLWAADAPAADIGWLFGALCLYLLGGGLYLLIITLIVHRLVFIALRPRDFTPPYWINMGALAITTLAGSLIVLHAEGAGPLSAILPFVKGFTLFFWATATWWIPLLVILEIWRHGMRHVRLRYESDDWNVVFPLGMYTVGTQTLAQALQLDFLRAIPQAGVYISLLAWLLVGAGGIVRTRRWLTAGHLRRHLQ